MKKMAWLIGLAWWCTLVAVAQQPRDLLPSVLYRWYPEYVTFLPSDKLDSVLVYANTDLVPVVYKVNKSRLQPNAQLDSIVSLIHRIRHDTRVNLAYIWIGGSASPEGSPVWNRELGDRRSKELASYLLEQTGIPKALVRVENLGEDWYSVARMLQGSDFLWKDEILGIIADVEDGEERKRKIKALDDGRTWQRLVREVFPPFRNARMVIVCFAEGMDVSGMEAVRPEMPAATALGCLPMGLRCVPLAPSPCTWRRVVALKSNVLALGATLVANLGIEVGLAPQWSLDVPIYYSPYDLFRSTRKVRVFATQPEVRYWLEEVGHRHFVGLHGHVAGFNIALNDHGRCQDPNRALWGLGLSYGYALSFGKGDRWGVEFTAGLGFANYKYDRYENIGIPTGLKLDSSGIRWYWGVTRAGITLSYKWFGKERERRTRR